MQMLTRDAGVDATSNDVEQTVDIFPLQRIMRKPILFLF